MNMRLWLAALAEPKRMAAQVLTTSPMKVRTLGLMRERASQRTMVSSRTPQARPKALVHDLADDRLTDGVVDDAAIRLWPRHLPLGSVRFRSTQHRREWCGGSESPSPVCHWE